MSIPSVAIIVWNRKRRDASGKLVRQKRHAVQYRCPDTGNKRRQSFASKVDAEARRDVLLARFAGEWYFNGSYAVRAWTARSTGYFLGLRNLQQWPQPRTGGGGPILYSNFLKRYWRPALKVSGIRYVTHHSARHSFVSTLQALGVEVGLVARTAGHANPNVTLGHYTRAVRGGADAVAVLDAAY